MIQQDWLQPARMAGIAVTSMELCGSCRCLHGLDEGMSVWAVPLGLALVVILEQAKEHQK